MTTRTSQLPKGFRVAKPIQVRFVDNGISREWYERVDRSLEKVKAAHKAKRFHPIQIKLEEADNES